MYEEEEAAAQEGRGHTGVHLRADWMSLGLCALIRNGVCVRLLETEGRSERENARASRVLPLSKTIGGE